MAAEETSTVSEINQIIERIEILVSRFGWGSVLCCSQCSTRIEWRV